MTLNVKNQALNRKYEKSTKMKKSHPITYEHLGIVILCVGALIFIFFAFYGFDVWFYKDTETQIKEEIKSEEKFWHCFSKDGRINYAVVRSKVRPPYLPVSGNEGVAYNCDKIEVFNFDD